MVAPQIGVFEALADATRRSILESLRDGEVPAGELSRLGTSQSAVSQHLRVLRRAGLVSERRAGRWRFYSLNPEPFREALDWFSSFDVFWSRKFEALQSYLGEER